MEHERAKVALTPLRLVRTKVRFVRCQIFDGHGEPNRRSSQQET